MSPLGCRVFRKHLAKIALLFIAAVLFGAALSPEANAQILNFLPAHQLVDNDANQGSPTVIVGVPGGPGNGGLIVYYVNHSNNTIYVDGLSGTLGNPESTGIPVWSAEITDVGAAIIFPCHEATCPEVLIGYVDPNQNASFATSTDGLNFGAGVIPTPTSLGIGNQNPYTQLVPAIALYQQPGLFTFASVATIGGADHLVYISTTSDGVNFTPLYGTGQPVSNYRTTSRPSLAYWASQGLMLIGFTSNDPGTRVAIVGPINTGPGSPKVTRADISWGNSNRNGNYAGIALTVWQGYIYVFGQDTASSQNLKYIYSNDDSSWSGPQLPGNQMRWTPSLTDSTQFELTLVYQDDANTDISWREP